MQDCTSTTDFCTSFFRPSDVISQRGGCRGGRSERHCCCSSIEVSGCTTCYAKAFAAAAAAAKCHLQCVWMQGADMWQAAVVWSCGTGDRIMLQASAMIGLSISFGVQATCLLLIL